MNYQRRNGLILIFVILLDQALAVHRIVAAARRSNRALNYNVAERNDEIESDKGIAKRETKVRVKRSPVLVAGVFLLIAGLLALSHGEKRVIICDRTGGKLWMKCASKDDNFDGITLVDGTCTGWKFHPNLFWTTLFYCDFSWNGRWKHIDVWKKSIGQDASILWDFYGFVDGPPIRSSRGQQYWWGWFFARCLKTYCQTLPKIARDCLWLLHYYFKIYLVSVFYQ